MGTFFDLRPRLGRVAMLAAVLGALTLAGIARAETITATLPFSTMITVPCSFEMVTFDGVQHFKSTMNGGLLHLEHNLQNVKGIAAVSGAKYVASDTESVLLNDIPPGSVVNIEHVQHFVRQKEDGTFVLGDDFKLKTRTQVVFNANSVPTVTKFDATTDPCQ